jgi:hypothetical protein
MSRRTFMAAGGLSTLALQQAVFTEAAAMAPAQPNPAKKPVIRVAIVRPDVDRYWLGWPGAGYDIKARQADYTKVLQDAAAELDVQLEVHPKPLAKMEDANAWRDQVKSSPPDGVILVSQSLNQSWPLINEFVSTRGDTPTVVFSPMGTSFTGHLQKTRAAPRTFVAATYDYTWLATGLRMLWTVWKMRNSRLAIIRGKARDQRLDTVGTTLHWLPESRWLEEYQKIGTTDEMRALAEYYRREAKKIVEPTGDDILNGARHYLVARKLMAEEQCDGISLNCLPLVGGRKVPCGPCLAWSRLNDEGSVGACEADWGAALALRLTSYLCQRPGFMQDPAPNTVDNTLMGAHCTSPTKLRGFDQPHEPFILRSHSEADNGCAVQVLWPLGERATVIEFQGTNKLCVGTGTVVRNIDTPPSGGCRTSVELAMDGAGDCRDTKGFHQPFIYGKLDHLFKAYCQLAGIEFMPLLG